MVSDDEGEGAAWGCELAVEPVPLSGFFRGVEVKRLRCGRALDGPEGVDGREVSIKEKEGGGFAEVFPVPF